jgi:pre-mRNA-processing factor SLU7
MPPGFAEVKKRVRTTAGGSTGSVRNLRIREDTAKYLLNLNPDSAYYDPKSRCVILRKCVSCVYVCLSL